MHLAVNLPVYLKGNTDGPWPIVAAVCGFDGTDTHGR